MISAGPESREEIPENELNYAKVARGSRRGFAGGKKASWCSPAFAEGRSSHNSTCRTSGCGCHMLESEIEQVNAVNDVPGNCPFEVVLDSGAAEHVADNVDAPGYAVEPSPGSRAGAGFIAANGEKIPNRGQMCLKLSSGKGVQLSSTFQVCRTTRPLWSVGRICDSGCSVTFDSKGAAVKHLKSGRELCSFQRTQGLYVGTLQLGTPEGVFSRQG